MRHHDPRPTKLPPGSGSGSCGTRARREGLGAGRRAIRGYAPRVTLVGRELESRGRGAGEPSVSPDRVGASRARRQAPGPSRLHRRFLGNPTRHLLPRATRALALALWVATVGAIAGIVHAGETYRRVQLVPRDEAVTDPSFRAFRAGLDAAVAAKNASALRALLATDVLINFGGESGPDAFFERWQPGAADSKLWELLAELLRSGSTYHRESGSADATYPFFFESFPDDFDGFTSGVIVGRNVNVRERPDSESPVIAQLSYDVVRVPDWGEGDPQSPASPWTHVELHDGTSGYVSRKLIRSPAGYRVGFQKNAGSWKLTYLVAGD